MNWSGSWWGIARQSKRKFNPWAGDRCNCWMWKEEKSNKPNRRRFFAAAFSGSFAPWLQASALWRFGSEDAFDVVLFQRWPWRPRRGLFVALQFYPVESSGPVDG